jgi:hypothetical protein
MKDIKPINQEAMFIVLNALIGNIVKPYVYSVEKDDYLFESDKLPSSLDIENLKKLKLEDLIIEKSLDPNICYLTSKDNIKIQASNRDSNNGEIRRELFQKEIVQLKNNPEIANISVYEAIQEINIFFLGYMIQFESKDIENLKKLKLEDLIIKKSLDQNIFYLTSKDNIEIQASNRDSNNGEMRGELFKEKIKQLKRNPENAQISVYEAIEKINEPLFRDMMQSILTKAPASLPVKDAKFYYEFYLKLYEHYKTKLVLRDETNFSEEKKDIVYIETTYAEKFFNLEKSNIKRIYDECVNSKSELSPIIKQKMDPRFKLLLFIALITAMILIVTALILLCVFFPPATSIATAAMPFLKLISLSILSVCLILLAYSEEKKHIHGPSLFSKKNNVTQKLDDPSLDLNKTNQMS